MYMYKEIKQYMFVNFLYVSHSPATVQTSLLPIPSHIDYIRIHVFMGGSRGDSGVSLEPSSPSPVFKYPMKMKQFGLSETKLCHFHGIFKISKASPPHICVYDPPTDFTHMR